MPSTRLVIALDVGGTKTAAALMSVVRAPSPGGQAGTPAMPTIVKRTSAPTDVSSESACLAAISECIDGLTREVDGIEGIGLGVASLVDFAHGRSAHSIHLPLEDVPVAERLERRHKMPVVVDNDATAACIGEHAFGAGAGSRHMLMLTLGTGVGGGIIVDARPYRGHGGSAAELGHLMIDVNGPKCPGQCPNHGCLEAYVSGTAMSAAARRAAAGNPSSALGRALACGDVVDSRLLTRLAVAGDEVAISVLARVGEYLGAGLVTLVNVFNPEVIVIGGGAAAAGQLLLAPARRVLAARGLPPNRDQALVVPAALGPDAGLFGAAALALERLENGAESRPRLPRRPS